LVGLLGGGLITGLLSDPTRRAAVEADQETAAGANFTNHQNDLDFRYYSPNYSSQLFSSDLIR
jgi:hypothetical protein